MARSRAGFRHLRVGRAGRVSVSFRGEDAPSPALAEIVEAYDGWRGVFRLLDEDMARLDEVLGVAEEAVELVFRGRYRTVISIWTTGVTSDYATTNIDCYIMLGSRDAHWTRARLVPALNATIVLDYGEGSEEDHWEEDEAFAADYTAEITIRLDQDGEPDPEVGGLIDILLRELAEIFSEPDIVRLRPGGRGLTLYARHERW
jgi:hypothetical protein